MNARTPVVLYGAGAIAQLVRFFLEHESRHEVVAATVDRDHLARGSVLDLPLVPFDEVSERYPPESHAMFVAIGYSRMNGVRAGKCEEARALGYDLLTHVSPRASTWPDLTIGDNCLVMDNVVVHPFATIGNDCLLWSGCYLGHGATLGDHCYVAARASVSGFATIGERTFLGNGSIVRDSITVGSRSLVGAGAVLTADAADGSIYASPPTRLLRGHSDRLPSF